MLPLKRKPSDRTLFVTNVGDLKAALANLPDDMLIAEGRNFFHSGLAVAKGSMVIVGGPGEEVIVFEDDPTFKKYKGERTAPFEALVIG